MKKSKKLLSLLVAVVLLMSCFSAFVANADDSVAINSINFPDATFRQVVAEYYDDDGDGFLSPVERNVSYMSVSGMIDIDEENITTIKGIEYFTALVYLRCGGIGLTSLDVSALTNLQYLTCEGNKLTELDVMYNSKLKELNCSDNELTYLELPYSTTLTKLHCYANHITELGINRLNNLKDLRCDQNDISYIDFSNNIFLEKLNCSDNHLTSINLSRNTALGKVTEYMIGNQNITLQATLDGNRATAHLENSRLTPANDVTSVFNEYNSNTYFDGEYFVTDDLDAFNGGVEYLCSPVLADSERMSVIVTIERDFYQVNFYSDDSLTSRLGWSIVQNGGNAAAPTGFESPACTSFAGWSDTFDNVTEDKSVFAQWQDNHNYEIFSFDGEWATLICSNCGKEITVRFIDSVNAKTGDDNYYNGLDAHSDGYINAKDYAKLCKLYNVG